MRAKELEKISGKFRGSEKEGEMQMMRGDSFHQGMRGWPRKKAVLD